MSATHVEYYHFSFDRHQVVWADGAPAESFLFAEQSIKALSSEARAEVEAIFPDLLSGKETATPARHIPEGSRQKTLVARHIKNDKAMLEQGSAELCAV